MGYIRIEQHKVGYDTMQDVGMIQGRVDGWMDRWMDG